MSEQKLFKDEHGNIWPRTRTLAPYGFVRCHWELISTDGDTRPSHELWHPGRGETKAGESEPSGPLKPMESVPGEGGGAAASREEQGSCWY